MEALPQALMKSIKAKLDRYDAEEGATNVFTVE